MLERGTIIGGTYEIMEEIGSGGGGIVYKARHIRLETDVVVKKIRDEVRNKIQSRQEADVLKKLKHPYLPRVYDFIDMPEGVFTVMDFVPGISLADALKQYHRFSQKQVLQWAEELGEALAYLHGQHPSIIHSDIKPANIILTPQGHICLIDFNISIVLDSSMKATLGISAGYSSPEQYRDIKTMQDYLTSIRMTQMQVGNSQQNQTQAVWGNNGTELLQDGKTIATTGQPKISIDRRSDIYSLGCVLYHLLAGFPPSTDFNKRMPISQVPGVSEGFALIIEKMIQYYPEQRYQDGKEYLNSIRNCYKLDKRYIQHYRKEKALFVSSLLLFMIGSLLVGAGIIETRKETERTYQAVLQEVEEIAEDGDYESAIEMVQELEEKYDSKVEAYERELYYYYLTGQYEECIDRGNSIIDLQKIELRDDTEKEIYGDIFYIIANSYFEVMNYTNAETAIEEAISYNANNSLYYRDYCIILAKQGRLESAQKALLEAIDLDLGDDSIYYAEAEICAAKGKINEAIEGFKKTINTTDDAILKKRAVLLCATMLRDYNRLEEEITLLETARNQADKQEKYVITEYLADAYMRMGDSHPNMLVDYNNKALALFLELKQNGYITYQLLENMAILYEENLSFDEAQSILEQMNEQYPNTYKVYKRLAFLEADRQQYLENNRRDYTKMKQYYEKAKELYEQQKTEDLEMQMLENMIRDLQSGGWF